MEDGTRRRSAGGGSRALWAAVMGMSLLVCEARAEAWRPAPAPLMTRWATEVSPENVWPEYPRPQMARTQWQSLNGLWQYAVSDRAAAAPQAYTGDILVPFCIESALSGVGKKVLPQQALWYRREFQTPKKWKGQRLLLHFDAADWETTVWLNGKQVGTHRGGYDRFTFDITDALTADGPQQLVVRVWDPNNACFSEPNGTWPHQPFGKQAVIYIDAIHYTSVSGIWQSVWLEPVPAASIESLRLVPDVGGGCLRLTATARGSAEGCTIEVEAKEGEKIVSRGAGKSGGEIVLPIANAKLWSPDQPFLYDLKVTLKDGSGASDTVTSYFAMRKIAIGPDEKGVTRILLNGKAVFQMGPLDQGYWPDGLYTAPTDAALRFDVELLKRLGFNVVRKHVKVEPERWYYWCDKLGMMVWQDMPSTLPPSCANQPELKLSAEDEQQFERELRRMVEQYVNHPSIVMWVIFNETWGQHRSVELTKAVKALDPTRLVNTASGAQDLGAGDVKDGHQYPGPLPGPGPASPNASPTQWQWGVEAKPEAKRAIVLGEFGGSLRSVEGHTWKKSPNIGGVLSAGYPLFKDKEALTARYEEQLLKVVKLNREIGASAAIYTSLSDIEDEINGFITYDREVLKMDEERVRAANLQAISAVTSNVLSLPAPAASAGAAVEFKKLPTEAWSAIIPAQKDLPPDWVKSLTARGNPKEYQGDALMKIGMPAGGICAGLVYLGGDGKLWWWDIFNRKLNGVQPRQIHYKGRSWHGLTPGLGAWQGGNYIEPVITQPSPFQQGFALRLTIGGKTQFRNLDRTNWKSVTFSGSYPVGTVTYADPDCPVRVKLEAYSPFIPLDFDNSSYPATIMSYKLENTGSEAVQAEVVGWLENAVLIDSGRSLQGVVRTNRVTPLNGGTLLACAAARPPAVETGRAQRPEIVFDDFEKDVYEGWTVEGTAFGKGPVARQEVPAYQGDLSMHGSRAVNSHAPAEVGVKGSDAEMSVARDNAKGKLISRPFKVERDSIGFLIGGGNRPECALQLVADGKVLRSARGHDNNKLSPGAFDVRDLAGQTVHLEIIDQAGVGWGNIGVDHIVFTDKSPENPQTEMTALADWGTLALATIGPNKSSGSARLDDTAERAVFDGASDAGSPMDKPLIGGVAQALALAPGASGTAKFLIAWHFANQPAKGVRGSETGWYYGKRFKDAAAVVTHIAAHEPELSGATLLWRDTWLDSTLPYWFLDRSFISLDCLASTTCYRFADGRFYTFEGVRSCEGHPNHVWHYAQGHARLFPELEQDVLERVWYGFGFHADGSLAYRGEVAGNSAIDGHCGVILSVLRNFQTSPDGAALKRIWPRVKKSIEYAMACDRDGNGLLDAPMLTTLDEPWHGEIPWISSLYIAALKAGEVMATEMGDAAFAADCRDRAAKGRAAMDTRLFNGEWFIQQPDPANLTKLGAYETVHIDQVLGQAWAWQVGLGRVLNEATTRSALRSIWTYNFARNLDNYDAKADPKGRPYYGDGEGGLVMTANALGRKTPFGVYSGFACYLNETMNGFEYQAAAHMIAEGMVQEGLAVMKTLDERYDGNKRNPFDEVECGDHYARSMASYGALIAISGFTYDGPHGAIGFAPRLTPENFKCAFTSAEGWGTYSQNSEVGGQRSEIRVKWGSLRLRTISLATPAKPGSATVKVGDKTMAASLSWQDGKATITLSNEVILTAGQSLEINLTK